MKKAKLIIIAYIVTLAHTVFAHAPREGDVYATTGAYAYRTYTPQTSDSDQVRYGGGIIAEADVDKNGGVEIGMLYLDKLYFREKKDHLLVEKIKRMYVSTGYRHWFNPRLSSALAFYSSYSMGDAVIVEGEHEDHTIETSARDITEYGFDFSLQWEMWSTPSFSVVGDARYSLSMTSKSRENANVYGVLIGLKYQIPKTRSENDL